MSVSSGAVSWFWESRGWRACISTLDDRDCCKHEYVLQWTDGICSVFRVENVDAAYIYRYRYEGLAEGSIDFVTRRIDLKIIDPLCSDATLFHFLSDVLLPAILDHQGALVLHAGAVIIEGAAALFLGESGRGKSTLTASFYAEGHTILSDDGVIVTCTKNDTRVEAVYPGVRLLPGTLSDLFGDPIATTEVAHYASKRRIVPDSRMSSASFPVAALFFLTEPSGTASVSISPMGAADACIGIVSKSFALDPSDKLRARSRIEQASRLATAVPSFALDYPREISALPQVRQAIAGTIAHTRQAQLGLLTQK